MRTIDIDHKDYQAIRREISERLRVELGIELEPPACLKGKVDELCGLEGKSSSVVPDVEHGFKNKPSANASRGEKSWLTGPWWPKS
jgi:hypothetical protein